MGEVVQTDLDEKPKQVEIPLRSVAALERSPWVTALREERARALREEIAQTVGDSGEIDAELRALQAALES